MELPIIKKTAENIGKKEWDIIDGILPLLLKKGCLTDIECRIIASTENLWERKCAIYDLIISKTNEETSELIAVLRSSTQNIRAKEKSVFQNQNCNQKENDQTLQMANNPFLNNTVIKNLFAFLHVEDIKNCGLVCHSWNSTAEIVFRKRSIIHFRPNVLLPSNFLKLAKYSLLDVPYLAFKFSSAEDSPLSITEIQEFFAKYGENVKELRLEGMILTDRNDAEDILPSYDVSPWFSNCSNIESLTIDTSPNKNATPLCISLDKLTSIKTIALCKCRILFGAEYKNNRIAPNWISLMDVNIQIIGHVFEKYNFHDFIDFSQARTVALVSPYNRSIRRVPKLDMKSQVFKTNRLYLINIEVENWAEAKGVVQFLRFQGFDFVEKSALKIKELVASGKNVIDLSALPQSIEKLKLLETNQIICTSELIEVPNLKYLLFDIVDNNSHLLTHFTNCPNLTELELDGSEDVGKLYLICIPRTVKKLKLNCVHIKFVDHTILQIDKLILDDKKHNSQYIDFVNVMAKIKAKVLVVVVTEKTQLPATDMMKLVEANNMQSPKIIIGSSKNVNLLKDAEVIGSAFAGCVDRRSNYYLFKNKIGKAIPQMLFNVFKSLDDINIK